MAAMGRLPGLVVDRAVSWGGRPASPTGGTTEINFEIGIVRLIGATQFPILSRGVAGRHRSPSVFQCR